MTFYLGENRAARECAKKLVAVILTGGISVDWDEVLRVANRPEYRNVEQCRALVREMANELKIKSPLHSD